MSNAVPLRGEADKEIGAGFAPLSVSAQDVPNLTVRIRAGSYWNADGVVVEFPGGNSPMIAAPGSLNRWTLVSMSSTGSVTITHGASSAAPSIPVPPAGSLPLAAIYMTAATTQITNAAIQDVRPIYAVTETVPNLAAELADRPTFTDVANDLAGKADVDGTPNSDFALNKGAAGPANAQVSVDRGASPTVGIRWNEVTDTWQFTNDGVTYADIASISGVFMDLVTSPTAGHVLTTDSGGQAIDSGTALSALATTASVTTALATKVSTAGDTMTGLLVLSGDPVANLGAATKQYVDAAVATKADDADVVHITGNETIAGTKTFTSNVVVDNGPPANPTVVMGVFGGTDMGLEVTRQAFPANPAIIKWDEATDTWQVGIVGGTVSSIATVSPDAVLKTDTFALTGDVTVPATALTGPANSFAATLATVTSAGTYGSASTTPQLTLDAKGRTLSLTSLPIAISGSQVTAGAIGNLLSTDGANKIANAGVSVANLFLADGSVPATGDFDLAGHNLNVNGGNITNVTFLHGTTSSNLTLNAQNTNDIAFTLNNTLVGLMIKNAGDVLIGLDNVTPSSTNGFPYVPVISSAPTGTPTTNTGYAPLVLEDHPAVQKLWLYAANAPSIGWTAATTAVFSKSFPDSGYIATDGDVLMVNASGGTTTIFLPGSPRSNMKVTVKKVDPSVNVVTIDGNGSFIDGAPTQPLSAQWNSMTVTYSVDAGGWFIIAQV